MSLPYDIEDGLPAVQLLSAGDDTPPPPEPAIEAVATIDDDESYVDVSEPPLPVDGDGVWMAESVSDDAPPATASSFPVFGAPAESLPDIDPAQILRDRPDVYAGYYKAFYGANNDRNSSAWLDRVGGYSPEDYARYWYNAHGRFEGYAPRQGGAEVDELSLGDVAPVGRTTLDGIPLSKILEDRPDVFRAFFTEYYGANNDRHSDAWVQRVGGVTVEDYANYWYNAHGRVEGYVPKAAQPPVGAPDPIDPAKPLDPTAPGDGGGLPFEDPSLDPWNHPSIYPDWQPPYPGWVAPDGSIWPRPAEEPPVDAPAEPPPIDPPPIDPPSVEPPAVEPPPAEPAVQDEDLARPLVVHYREDGIDLLPATNEELTAMRTLFDDLTF